MAIASDVKEETEYRNIQENIQIKAKSVCNKLWQVLFNGGKQCNCPLSVGWKCHSARVQLGHCCNFVVLLTVVLMSTKERATMDSL